jgi:hypothetical protein
LGSIPKNGGNGGFGGLGGQGGLGGLAKITKLKYNLTDDFEIPFFKFGKPGRNGLDGKHGIGGIGGLRYKCIRSFFWRSWRCCKSTCLGVCCDYHTCDTSSWKPDLINTKIPGSG